MIAADVMTEKPVTVQPDDDIATAVALLHETSFRHLPVVDDDGELVGMLSDRDLRAVFAPFSDDVETSQAMLARARAPISTIMSSNVLCVDQEDDVSAIADLMVEHRVGAIPVIDGDGTLVGIVSYIDLIRHYTGLDRN